MAKSKDPMSLPYLCRGDKHSSERVRPIQCPCHSWLLHQLLKVKHWYGRAEEVGEMMQQNQPIAEDRDGDVLEVVVLHRYMGRETPGVDRLVGGPGETVGRATGHTVDLLA